MKITVETFTPEKARAELEEQEKRIAEGKYNQRSLSKSTVRRYANDMRQGHWTESDQGIGYDRNGNLINGRHRLHAVVMAGVPVDFAVFRGLAPIQKNGIIIHPQDGIDNGRTRTPAAQLQIDGVKYSTLMASVARCIGLMCCMQRVKIGIIPTRIILDMYDRHIQAVMDGLHHDTRKGKGFLIAILAMYRDKERAKADAFVQSHYDRANLDYGSPVLALARFYDNHPNIGTDAVINSLRAASLAVFHYHQGSSVNTLRAGSEIGRDWLLDLCRNNVRKVKEILGEDRSEGPLEPLAEEQAS